jgi:hypothetical protein
MIIFLSLPPRLIIVVSHRYHGEMQYMSTKSMANELFEDRVSRHEMPTSLLLRTLLQLLFHDIDVQNWRNAHVRGWGDR